MTRIYSPRSTSPRRLGSPSLQPYQPPSRTASPALERGLAILLDSDRYKEMYETARKVGLPHLVDPMKVYDLDRDPGTTSVYSSGGKKVREEQPEQTFTRIDRGPPRQVEIDVFKP
jgi:hypothetical protein